LSLLTLNFILWEYQITCPKSPQVAGCEGKKLSPLPGKRICQDAAERIPTGD
jgi:hypothetical protein